MAMKLLFLIKALSLPGGGAERVLADVTSELVERGHLVTIASFDPPGAQSFYPFHPAINRISLGVGDVSRRTGPREFLVRLRAIRHLVDRVDPDAVIGFMHSSYVPLRLALLGRPELPVIGSEHIVYQHYRERFLERVMVRILAPYLRAITAISNPMRDSFPPSISKRMVIVPNPVRAYSHGLKKGSADRGGMILTVGRLESQKDHATLVSAFAQICGRHPDWQLRIVGNGALHSALQAQIEALGLKRRVTLAGSVSEIDAEYAAADLFALPSRYESFGLATAEALAHGLPVVGFADCPGTNELVVEGVNGLLVKGDNRVDAFAEALNAMIESPELRASMARAAPSTVAAYNIENIVDQWEELLRKVVAHPTGSEQMSVRKCAG